MADPYRINIEPTRSNDPEGIGSTPTTLLETAEGDLVLGADGDLLVARPKETELQRAVYTAQTDRNSSLLFPGVGSVLRSFRGFIISEEVLVAMEESLRKDLVEDGVAVLEETVEVNPLDNQSGSLLVSFSVALPEGGNYPVNYRFDVDEGAIEQLGGGQI